MTNDDCTRCFLKKVLLSQETFRLFHMQLGGAGSGQRTSIEGGKVEGTRWTEFGWGQKDANQGVLSDKDR
jgi:hypothetical protein